MIILSRIVNLSHSFAVICNAIYSTTAMGRQPLYEATPIR